MIHALTPWIATMRDTAIAIGAVCGALLTIAAATKLPFVSKPLRWLWRELVSDPLRHWLGALIEEHFTPDRARMVLMEQKLAVVEHEVRTNDGQSLRDVADRNEATAKRMEEMAQILLDRTS